MKSPTTKNPHITLWTAVGVVIANMIGTGVFTSLGFQAAATPSEWTLLFLWVIGGGLAICGALSYAELGAAMPRSGGEYNYLSQIYHPSVGFLSGWVSGTVAFAAPIALAALAFGEYIAGAFPVLPPKALAVLVLVVITAVHLSSLKSAVRFQNISTLLKVLPIMILGAAGLYFVKSHGHVGLPTATDFNLVLTPPFAVSLVYVSYAYSGWNASTYLAGEVKNPERNVPLSVILGTLIVLVAYLVLNFIFIHSIPMNELKGTLQVGALSGQKIFGPLGGKIVSLFIGLGLIATISSMLLASSRVLKTIGEDFAKIGWLARSNNVGHPRNAILIQAVIALALLLTSSFDQVLTYVSFTLTLFTVLTVAGIYRLRAKTAGRPRPHTAWGYPYTPAIFIVFNLYMMIFLLMQRPLEAVAGLLTVITGAGVYFWLSQPTENLAAKESPCV